MIQSCSLLLLEGAPPPPHCRRASPPRATVSNSMAEDEDISKPLQVSLVPLRGRSLLHEQNNNTNKSKFSERMLIWEHDISGPPVPPLPPRPKAHGFPFEICWIILCAGIFCLHRAADTTSLQYEALFIIHYCITLTLVTITKLCLKQEGDTEENCDKPCPAETPFSKSE